MSTNREPFVTDADITKAAAIQGDASMAINKDDFAAGERARGYIHGAHDTRALYEAELSRKDAEIDVLRNPWISTKDQEPESGQLVVVWANAHPDKAQSTPGIHLLQWVRVGDLHWPRFNTWRERVTHFMTIPTPPKP
jgi:hypothetical protein